MRTPLAYQRSEFDCGPTAFLNAINFLFQREEIPPDIIKNVMTYSLDTYDENGQPCREGTSQMAMMFLSHWLNQYAKVGKFRVQSEFISGEDVYIGDHSRIVSCLQQGGAVIMRLWDEVGHYVTLTGIEGDFILLFDPYYDDAKALEEGIVVIADKPFQANRKVHKDIFHRHGYQTYALEEFEKREAVLLFNEQSRLTPEKSIEYFL